MENKIGWYFVEPLQDAALIDEYEQHINFRFPQDFRECVMQHNGGAPFLKEDPDTPPALRFVNGEIEDFRGVESFNKTGDSTIWSWAWEDTDFDRSYAERYVYFADDSFGNFYCFDRRDSSIVFIDHEMETVDPVAKTFTDLLNSLTLDY